MASKNEKAPIGELSITGDKIKNRVMALLKTEGIDLDKNCKIYKSPFFYKTSIRVSGNFKCINNVTLENGIPIATRERVYKDENLLTERNALRKLISASNNQFFHLQLLRAYSGAKASESIVFSNHQHTDVPMDSFNGEQAAVIAKFMKI